MMGVYCLLLDPDDHAARGHFRMAAEYALKSILSPKGDAPMRISEVTVSLDPMTMEVAESERPLEGGYGSARISVVDFENALYTLFAFGDEGSLRQAARVPEEDYRSPGIVQSERNWAITEAERLLALGDEAGAGEIYDRVIDDSVLPLYAERVRGLRAMWRGDQTGFRVSLEALLRLHRALAMKKPGDLAGLICFPGMIASRLALSRGWVVEDQSYLPLRFMPGHPQNPDAPAGADQ